MGRLGGRRGSRPALTSPMKSRSQSLASSIDSIGRCLPGSMRGIAKSFTATRNRVPWYSMSNCRCSRHLLAFLHFRCLHLRLMAIHPPLLVGLLSSCHETRRRASFHPLVHVGGMEPPSSHAEPL